MASHGRMIVKATLNSANVKKGRFQYFPLRRQPPPKLFQKAKKAACTAERPQLAMSEETTPELPTVAENEAAVPEPPSGQD